MRTCLALALCMSTTALLACGGDPDTGDAPDTGTSPDLDASRDLPDAGDPSALPALTASTASLATSAFVAVGKYALKKQCESGDGSACKLFYIADPDAAAKADFDRKLAAMNQQLIEISAKLDLISSQLSDLAKELKITGDELKVVIVQAAASTSFNNVQAAYNGLHSLGKTDDFSAFVVSALTTQGQGWNLPGALAQIHGNLLGSPELTESTANPGLFKHLDSLLHDKLLQGDSATASYEFLEEYFGDVLGAQARALLVIAAAYNYLDAHPDLKAWFQQGHLLIQTEFQSYVDNVFRPNIEKQVTAFLRSAERLLALGLDPEAAANALQPEAAYVLRRADLAAAWARSALLGQTQPLAVVRVVGEPDRVGQLQSLGGYKDGASGDAYQQDLSCIPAGSATGAALRAWPTTAPYIQFPIRPDNRIVRGAATLHMLKYVLADAGLTPGERQAAPAQTAAWVPSVTLTLEQLGPDGTPATEAPYLLFGHATAVLKDTAMCRLTWQKSGDGTATTACPQSATVTLKVSPDRTRKAHCSAGYCWDTYYIKGSGSAAAVLTTSFVYEGADDGVAPRAGKFKLTAGVQSTVRKPANNGSYSQTVTVVQGARIASASIAANTSATRTVSLGDQAIWKPATTVSVGVGVSESASWNASRESSSYPDSPFDGTLSATLKSFVLSLQ